MGVTTRPASTVVVIRDGARGVEVYLQRRPHQMQFAGGLWVFPGGRVDEADHNPEIDEHWAGPSPATWAAVMGVPQQVARGHVVAAYRETLEEAGILLVADPRPPADVAAARRALLAGTHTFVDVVRELDLCVDTTLLRYWAWWVTPAGEPRRYDTRFFLARLPPNAVITPHDDEVIDETWAAAPGAAPTMLPPTYYTMHALTALPSVEAAMASATERDVTRVQPAIEDGQIVLPWGDRYDLPPGSGNPG